MAELISNEIVIEFPDNDEAVITEKNILGESLRIRQSLCDEAELRFGGCNAAELRIDLINTVERQFSESLAGKWISVKITQHYATDTPLYPSATLFPSSALFPGKVNQTTEHYVFSGQIESAKVNKNNNNVFTVTAYDILAQLHETDATDDLYALYKARMKVSGVLTVYDVLYLVTNRFSIQLDGMSYREIFELSYYQSHGNTRAQLRLYPIHLNADWMNTADRITYGRLLKDICEMLAVFGRIKPDSGKGELEFKTLSGTVEEYRYFEPPLNAESFQSTGYTDFRFPVENSSERSGKSVTAIGGLTDCSDDAVSKVYDFSANLLTQQVYAQSGESRTSTEFDYFINTSVVGTRLGLNADSEAFPGACTFSRFRPLTVKLDGRLWVDVGAPIRIYANITTPNGAYVIDEETGQPQKETIDTYLLTRTLTGVQALTDEIEVKGMM